MSTIQTFKDVIMSI